MVEFQIWFHGGIALYISDEIVQDFSVLQKAPERICSNIKGDINY